jgi:hypothetical protein
MVFGCFWFSTSPGRALGAHCTFATLLVDLAEITWGRPPIMTEVSPLRLLAEKEIEIASLREKAISQLENQLNEKQDELGVFKSQVNIINKYFLETRSFMIIFPIMVSCMQFEQLKSDFQYNLKLLEERDSELEKYDHDIAHLSAAIAERDRQLVDLQKLNEDRLVGEVCFEFLEHIPDMIRHRCCSETE